MTLRELTGHLRNLRGVKHKLDIQPVHALLGAAADGPVAVGDDCAAIADGDGYLLLAIEGLLDEFVSAEPWFAGYCAVMVNVSDVYAMGGRPLAVVDALWTAGADRAGPIWDGMRAAAAKYAVPIVGGHTNSRGNADHLAAAILGRAAILLSSFDARPGDVLLAAIDLRGEWFGPYPWWNASTTADGARLRADLEILPALAEAGLCRAAKDISMAGLVGTAAMLAECSGIGIGIDISTIPAPFAGQRPKSGLAGEEAFAIASPGTPGEGQGQGLLFPQGKACRSPNAPHSNPLPEYREREKIANADESEILTLAKWLTAFPSYGFLLAVSPSHVAEVSAGSRLAAFP